MMNHFVLPSASKRIALFTPPFKYFGTEWESIGLGGHPSQAADLSKDAKPLGINFRDGVRLMSWADKDSKLVEAMIDLSAT